ncbi:MAG: hypothetical protein ACR2PG_21440 [Hyphomicrobiaceae bacterium]
MDNQLMVTVLCRGHADTVGRTIEVEKQKASMTLLIWGLNLAKSKLVRSVMLLANKTEVSLLNQSIGRSGHTVQVQVVRQSGQEALTIELVDRLGGSFIWRSPFPTDGSALAEVVRAITVDEITAFTRPPR